MIKRWDEKLADLSVNLARLSQKAADASEDAKAARELRQETINDRIGTAKGNVAAFQERIRIAGEEKKSKLGSALLKAQMTLEEKKRQRKEAKDKKHFESYIDDQISYIYENFETATYLIETAQLAILETLEAIDEYNAKYGTEEEAPEEAAAAEEENGTPEEESAEAETGEPEEETAKAETGEPEEETAKAETGASGEEAAAEEEPMAENTAE